jgi:hypothetical protein
VRCQDFRATVEFTMLGAGELEHQIAPETQHFCS